MSQNQLFPTTYISITRKHINIIRSIPVYSAGCIKKGNPTLACHCALITGCINVILCGHKDPGLSC